MKAAWFILIVSALTDFFITAGTAWNAVVSAHVVITRDTVITVLVGGLISFSRTIQQALKATPEHTAALKGDISKTATVIESKTP